MGPSMGPCDLQGDPGSTRPDRGPDHRVGRLQDPVVLALDRAPEGTEVDGHPGRVRGVDRGSDVGTRRAVLEGLHREFDTQRHRGAP